MTGKTTDRNKVTSLVPSKKGKLLVYGLEGDSYELTETKTDDGYTLLKDPVKIEVTPATQDMHWQDITEWKSMRQTGRIRHQEREDLQERLTWQEETW